MTKQHQSVIDGDNNILHEGDRVYSYDIDSKRYYGTLRENEFKNVSEWYIEYDDGNDCAVLDNNLIFKA